MNAEPDRLRLMDRDFIVATLKTAGFIVSSTSKRIDARCPDSGQNICQIIWEPTKTSKDNPEGIPARWVFNICLADLFSVKDITTAIFEALRVQNIAPKARQSWKDYLLSRSQKRWETYRGFVAALFLRQKV